MANAANEDAATVDCSEAAKEVRMDLYSRNDVLFVDPCDMGCSVSPTSGTAPGGAVDAAGILAFAHSPINSTWGVSDEAAEQWFLAKNSVHIARYGLTSANIRDVSNAIKAAGVSPAFIYAYAVTEGSGNGGFINHFPGETSGGAVGNAKRDAEYIVAQSQKMGDSPAWIDVQNPVDLVPADIKAAGNADFQNMPTGTIGRAYIPATAATTWEVYYPNGLKEEYNGVQDYGAPLQKAMNFIREMGGDPMVAGATISTAGASCSTGSTTTAVSGPTRDKVVQIAKQELALWESGQKKPGTDYLEYSKGIATDWCAFFVSWVYDKAGYPVTDNGSYLPQVHGDSPTNGLQTMSLTSSKFEYKPAGSYTPQPGDIAIYASHTNLVIEVDGAGGYTSIGGNEGAGGNGSYTESRVKSNSGTYWASQAEGFVVPKG